MLIRGADRRLMQRGLTVNFHFHMERQSPLLVWGDQCLTQRGSTVNFHFHMERQLPLLILGEGSTIDTKRINSQLSLSHGKVVTSVDWGGHLSPTSDPEGVDLCAP